MQYVPGGEILETNRAYHIWRCMSAIVSHFNPITPEQAEQVQPYFPGDLQYIFIISHHSQYWFQLFNKKCDVNKTIHIC